MLSYSDLKFRNSIGNYEHLIYYLDNENKSLPDCVQAIIMEYETRHIYSTARTRQRLVTRHLSPTMSPAYMPP